MPGGKGPGLLRKIWEAGSVSTEEKWLPARNDCLQRGGVQEVTVAWGNFSRIGGHGSHTRLDVEWQVMTEAP